ncbi:MAG: tetratricopeptide repeat protein [Candidatus Omnitrophica bacterium]|nr:tetratricopeptide repeat protein [Candidatus Omnitrophota bacterium]
MKSGILKIFVAILAVVTPVTAYGRVINDPMAAAMYNEMGVKAFKDGAMTAAVSYLEQAYKLNPSDKVIKKNLAVAYTGQGTDEYNKRDLAAAQKYFEAALKLDPENVNSLVMLGDIKYLSQKMDEAKILWEKVLTAAPDYKYRKDLEEKIAKLAKEAEVEKNYRSTGMDRFEIKYSREGARLSYNVRYYLQEAYRLLGQDFDYRPDYRIAVLISDREQFETLGGWPAGTQGGYDGKIRLPLIGADYTPDHIRGLVWHEYTHLLVEDLSNGKAPLWLNEGLAYYEGSRYMKNRMAALRAAADKNRLIPLDGLDMALQSSDDQQRYWLACEEACTIAAYMMKRYNKYTIREILKAMGEGETFEAVIKRKSNLSMKEFEKRWLTELNKGRLY